jgi:hypothetical protein
MKKTIAQCLVVFLGAVSLAAWAREDASDADGCKYELLVTDHAHYYRLLADDESEPSYERTPARDLDLLDADLKACSLPAGKDIPDADPAQNTWLEYPFNDSAKEYDTLFNQADALALAGPSVKDGVTRYWRKNGKTHIRFALNHTARYLRSWAKRQGIALQLTRQARGPVIIRGKTAIPVFVVSPQGLTPARIVAFAAGGDSCAGGNWLEVELSNATTPPVWALIALRDPKLAQKAKVTRQRQLETGKEQSLHEETKRGVLWLEFEDNALPPLTLVARQLEFSEEGAEVDVVDEMADYWHHVGEKISFGSVWGTEVFLAGPSLDALPEKKDVYSRKDAFDRHLSFLGSPACPPPAPGK